MTAWKRWRALLTQVGRAPPTPSEATDSRLDTQDAPMRSTRSIALEGLVGQIETTALAIYVAQGLPDREGHYARHPRTGAWAFIAEALTPPERFALVEANPPEHGWRFGRLPDLGLQSDDALLKAAGALLEGVAALRACRAGSIAEDDLHAAIRLGEAWGNIRGGQAHASSRLVLTAPEEEEEEEAPDAAPPASR